MGSKDKMDKVYQIEARAPYECLSGRMVKQTSSAWRTREAAESAIPRFRKILIEKYGKGPFAPQEDKLEFEIVELIIED